MLNNVLTIGSLWLKTKGDMKYFNGNITIKNIQKYISLFKNKLKSSEGYPDYRVITNINNQPTKIGSLWIRKINNKQYLTGNIEGLDVKILNNPSKHSVNAPSLKVYTKRENIVKKEVANNSTSKEVANNSTSKEVANNSTSKEVARGVKKELANADKKLAELKETFSFIKF